MRETRSTWRARKITVHFATVKAVVYVYLRHREHPVKTTEQVYVWSKRWGETIGVKVTYKMALEALHELQEQGFVDWEGNSYGLYWWSKERIV